MAETTKIAWCDATFNPWVGCTKVSPGCENCYAERDFDHRRRFVEWGPGKPRRLTSDANWKKPLAWNKKAQKAGEPIKVFSGSLCDVFDEEVADEWRDRLIDTINETPFLRWLLLTKRPDSAKRYFDSRDAQFGHEGRSNLWLGTTVCNQEEAGEKIPVLLETPAAGRFVSIEPMLGSIDLRHCIVDSNGYPVGDIDSLVGIHSFPPVADGPSECSCNKIDWVICGGETGPRARPVHPDWVRSLRDQCLYAKKPFFFKQWGEWEQADDDNLGLNVQNRIIEYDGTDSTNWTIDQHTRLSTMMVRVGKSVAGNELDGQTWEQIPKS